jgi:hypothetical protein
MNKIFKTNFLADSIDSDHIYVKCSIPHNKCPDKFHLYNSNGDWNSNRVFVCGSKCICNVNKNIKIKISNRTRRCSIVFPDKNKNNYIYSGKVFKDKIKMKNNLENYKAQKFN